mgnify:CR=1 FL=1
MLTPVLIALATFGAAQPGESVSFVACPVAQHLGPDRDVCFFTEHRGRRYALTNPPDWGAPQLGHKVLVEGVVTDRPAECGGIVLEGRVSVMPELSLECNTIAPLTPEIAASLDRRNPRADEIAAELAAIARDPARSLHPVRLRLDATATVALGRVETIYYPFESDRSSGPDAIRLVELAKLASATQGAHIRIRSYRGASRLDDGTVLSERRGMAQQRADKVAGILKGLGAERATFDITVFEDDTEPKGREDWKLRRVEISVQTRRE